MQKFKIETLTNQLKFKRNFKNIKQKFIALLCAFCILSFSGCTTTSLVPTQLPQNIPGIYHRVEKGQTLWRIAKIYNIDMDELVRVNRISDATDIEIGQLIYIPRDTKQTPLTYRTTPSEDFCWPMRGRTIAFFGQTSNNMVNKGINIAPVSDSGVVAARNGKVVFYSENFKGFGKTIIIEHDGGFSTVYARNSQVLVKVGDNIQKGSPIAKVGYAGRDKNIYLHFEIRKGHRPENPNFYLPR